MDIVTMPAIKYPWYDRNPTNNQVWIEHSVYTGINTESEVIHATPSGRIALFKGGEFRFSGTDGVYAATLAVQIITGSTYDRDGAFYSVEISDFEVNDYKYAIYPLPIELLLEYGNDIRFLMYAHSSTGAILVALSANVVEFDA